MAGRKIIYDENLKVIGYEEEDAVSEFERRLRQQAMEEKMERLINAQNSSSNDADDFHLGFIKGLEPPVYRTPVADSLAAKSIKGAITFSIIASLVIAILPINMSIFLRALFIIIVCLMGVIFNIGARYYIILPVKDMEELLCWKKRAIPQPFKLREKLGITPLIVFLTCGWLFGYLGGNFLFQNNINISEYDYFIVGLVAGIICRIGWIKIVDLLDGACENILKNIAVELNKKANEYE